MKMLPDYPRTHRMPLYAVEQLEEAPEGDPCYLMHYATEVEAYVRALEAERDAALAKVEELRHEKLHDCRDLVKLTWRNVALRKAVKDPSGHALLQYVEELEAERDAIQTKREALEAERDTLQEALHTVCNGIPGDIELTLHGGPMSEKVKDALSEHSLHFYRPMFGNHD